MIYNSFLLVSGLTFHFLNSTFQREEFLNFYEIWLSNFLLELRFWCPTQVQDFSLIFSKFFQKSYSFRFYTLISIYNSSYESKFFFFAYESLVVPTYSLNSLPLLHRIVFSSLSKISWSSVWQFVCLLF
jgi:hypothetical protein